MSEQTNGSMRNDEGSTISEGEIENWMKQLDNKDTKSNLRTAGFIFGSTVAITVGLISPFVISRSPLPYMPTPKTKVYRALEFLNKRRMKNGVFIDLGSGDGEAVLQAARLGYRATGLELNFTLWALSSLRRRLFWSAKERSNSQFLWANFFAHNIRDANTVMIFGVNPLMTPLSQKLQAECRPGTHILSYRFALPLAFKDRPDLLQAKIIYDEHEMRIYETVKTHKG